MNITPQVPNLSIPTVLNPHTESLRRENNQREIITQPAATSQSAAEKGVASDRERSRTPAQNNANIDFVSIKEQAELANSSIAEQKQDQSGQHNDHSHSQNNQEENDDREVSAINGTADKTENNNSVNGDTQTSAQAVEQERIISELKQRDQEVRAHEAAHAAVGGSVTGSPNLSYENGPDGKRYAVDGEVAVDLSPVNGDPRATIAKMKKVHAAALAPMNPSSQDTQVASTATQVILQAQAELLSELGSVKSEEQGRVDKSETASTTKSFSAENDNSSAHEYDVLMNKTLNNQDEVLAEQPDVFVQRALRIESFYAGITQAYEKPPSNNFELTA
jgi:hypothetical protein